MDDIKGHIRPDACVTDQIAADSQTWLSVMLRTNDAAFLVKGTLCRVEGFERWRFDDGLAEFIRKDYRGENVSKCLFRRVKVASR